MGFFNRVSNWLNTTGKKIYNGIRNGVATGYNAVKNIGQTIGKVSDGIDGFLNNAKSIPLVGQLATAIQANPIYSEVRAGIKTGNDVINTAGDIGGKVGAALDSVMPPGS